MTKKINIGDTIKINESIREHIQIMKNNIDTHVIAYNLAAEQYKKQHQRLFDFICEKYPELENFHFSVKHDTHEILILGDKEN